MKAIAMLVLVPSFAGGDEGNSGWTHWGGPTGDFKVVGPELVEVWPESGPRRLVDGVLYVRDKKRIVALDLAKSSYDG